MRQTTAHHPYVGLRALSRVCSLSARGVLLSLHGPSPASRTRCRRSGFTLIEVIVAMAILMIIVVGTFSAVSFAYSTSATAEGLNTAKNIADYTIEYLRSRNVTHQDDHGLGLTPSQWYPGTGTTTGGVTTGGFPGIMDLAGEPLNINHLPLCPLDAAGGPSTSPGYAYSSLQSYVSLRDVATIVSGSDDPLEPNASVKVAGVGTERRYVDAVTSAPYVIRFPLDSSVASPAPILAFAAWGDYHKFVSGAWQPTVWGSSFLAGTYPDPHFTLDSGRKTACTSYRGYRVLTQIRALSASATYKHVQTYDIRVTVLWMVGAKERRYVVSTTIATY